MLETAVRKRVDVQVVVGPENRAAGSPGPDRYLAELLAQSPYWDTSTIELSELARAKTSRAKVFILSSPVDVQVPHSVHKIIRLTSRDSLDRPSQPSPANSRDPGVRQTLTPFVADSCFACTSEEVREALLAMFPGIRHRTYVVPSSYTSPGTPAHTSRGNEAAHWQELIRDLTRRRDIPRAEPVRVTALRPREIKSSRPLSIIISSEGFDERLATCLDRIAPQIEAANAELLVGLKDPSVLETSRWPQVRFFQEAGGNVLSLRARGISMATGEVVAIMEDHGLPAKDWCQRVIDIHRAHPATPIVYGPVMHGGPFGITSWANFLVNYGLFMPPLEFAPRRRVPPIVGITIKRSYLPDGDIAEGWFEFVDMPKFHDLRMCRHEDSLLVRHIQHHGFLGTYAAHYHNARVTTGSRKLVKSTAAWKDQLRNSFRVPVQIIGIDWAEIWALKRRRGLLLKTLPSYVLIVLAHTLGEIVGLYRGSGRSAEHID